MKLHELSFIEGARKKRKRVGRGQGSGTGKTSGKGHKGQNARSGGGVRLGFEGGQTPLQRRLPKRGFNNIHRVEYAIVNIADLEKRFPDNTVVDLDLLLKSRLVRKVLNGGVKILGHGELTKKFTVKAHKFSKSAESAIVKSGGSIEVL